MISVQAGRISFTALSVAVTRFARRPFPFAGASPGQGRMSPSAWALKRSTTYLSSSRPVPKKWTRNVSAVLPGTVIAAFIVPSPSVGNGGGASLRDAIRRPASGQPLLPSARDTRPTLIAIGSRDGGQSAAAASMSSARRTRGAGSSASRLGGPGAGGDVVVPAPGGFASVDPDEPAAHDHIAAVRAADPGSAKLVRAADGRRERPERPACGELRPARHGGDPRQRDDDARRGGVRRAGGLRRNAPSLPAGLVAERRTRGAVSHGNARESGSDGALNRPGAQ